MHRLAAMFGRMLALALLAGASGQAAGLSQFKVLYVGNATNQRAAEFKAFLSRNVAQVEIAERTGFDPRRAEAFDVVLLDWPQAGPGREFPPKTCPLGPREQWSKPAVLLGSAGLNVAIAWMAKGGSG